MTKINRRSILSGLATMPLLSSGGFSAQSHHSSGTRWLYVYIHGAFVVELEQNGVRLILPRVDDGMGHLAHEYRAGYLPNGEGTPLDPVAPVAFTGFLGASTAPQIDKTTIPCLDNVSLGYGNNNVYCGAVLPTPDAIVPLRQVPQSTDLKPFFSLVDLKDLKWLPLLLLLQYELQPNDHPALVGGGGNWKDDGRNPLILHFRAEPGSAANADHDAISVIASILNKKMMLDACYAKALACGKSNEEQSLLEIRNPATPCVPALPCNKNKEVIFNRPANCVTIVVNNAGG